MTGKLLSVCVPVHNAARYVEPCVRSLFGQTYADVEYVFVDDCSSDDGLEIVSAVAREYPRCLGRVKIVRHETNRGAAAARQTAVSAASGELIAFCDADDWLDPDHYATMIARMTATGSEVGYCSARLHRDAGCEDLVTVEDEILSGAAAVQAFDRIRGSSSLVLKVWDRSLFSEALETPFGLKVAEDLCLCVQLLSRAKKVCGLSRVVYHYRIIQSSAIRTVEPVKVVGDHMAVYDVISRTVDENISQTVRRYLSRVVLYWGVVYGLLTAEEYAAWRMRYETAGGSWTWSDMSPWGRRIMGVAKCSFRLSQALAFFAKGRVYDHL